MWIVVQFFDDKYNFVRNSLYLHVMPERKFLNTPDFVAQLFIFLTKYQTPPNIKPQRSLIIWPKYDAGVGLYFLGGGFIFFEFL